MCINNKFYAKLGNRVKKNDEKYFDIDDLNAISSSENLAQKTAASCKSNAYKRQLFRSNSGSRESIMSQIIANYRKTTSKQQAVANEPSDDTSFDKEIK